MQDGMECVALNTAVLRAAKTMYFFYKESREYANSRKLSIIQSFQIMVLRTGL